MLDIELMGGQAAEPDSRGNFVMKPNSEKLEGSLSVELGQQLLPGIPDEITLNLVTPKLPWTDFHRLSSVSRGWQQAIGSRQIYDARLRSQSTQTLVVIKHRSGKHVRGLALYSLSDNSFHQLPPFPGVNQNGELPWGCQCISLDGKVYILGGDIARCAWTTNAVYVLDLAGQQRWKQCTRMQRPRSEFGCGVMNGKIYVFGGRTYSWGSSLVHGCEVYDPKVDAWSPIVPMTCLRFRPQVLTTAEEFLVSSGSAFRKKHGFNWRPQVYPRERELSKEKVQVYDPFRNQWRIMDGITEDYSTMLTVGGKLHRLTWRGIEVYDIHENSWRLSESFSLAVTGPPYPFRVNLFAAVAVDDELLAVAGWEKGYGQYGLYLMRSQGFDCPKRETVWQDTHCSFSSKEYDELPFLCAIQL